MCGCNNLLHIGTFSCRPDSRGFFPDLGFHVNSCVVQLFGSTTAAVSFQFVPLRDRCGHGSGTGSGRDGSW